MLNRSLFSNRLPLKVIEFTKLFTFHKTHDAVLDYIAVDIPPVRSVITYRSEGL